MPYLEIANFKLGLDTRKCELTANVGSLLTLDNAHINQGGEIERRRAFNWGAYFDADHDETAGFEMEPAGAVVFGSAASPPASLTAYPTFAAGTIPASYQALIEPYAAGGVMTDITTCQFLLKSFAIVLYNDGRTVLFYNGTAVRDSYAGVIFGNLVGSPTNTAAALIDWINNGPAAAAGYTAALKPATTDTVRVTNAVNFTMAVGAAGVTVTGSGGYPGPATSIDLQINTATSNGTLALVLVSAGVTVNVGYDATFTGVAFTFCYTFKNYLYLLAGSKFYRAELGSATSFKNSNGTGNGIVNLAQSNGTGEALVTMCHYQGKLAFLFRNSIQIWETNASLALFSLIQILENIGCIAKYAICPMGDLDILFVADSGVRSLRVRDISSNAYVTDIGSPIDTLITDLLGLASTIKANICCGCEPTGNRFWVSIPTLYLTGLTTQTIYVLSYFPQSKIVAWSNYKATFQGSDNVQAAFYTITRLITYNGALYCDGCLFLGGVGYRGIFSFGVFSGVVGYDNCQITAVTPWLTAGTAGHFKTAKCIEAVNSGKWDIICSMDPYGQTTNTVSEIGTTLTPDPKLDSTTVKFETFGYVGRGMYFQLKAQTVEAAVSATRKRCILASLIFHYILGNEKS